MKMIQMNYKSEFLVSEKKLRNKTIISFIVFTLFIVLAIFTWKWLYKQPAEAGAIKPLRTVLDYNQTFFSNFLSDNHLAKTYPVAEAATRVRVNGNVGMDNNFDATGWKLQVVKNGGDTLFITLDDIKALPKTDIVFDFKCIEGWSQVTHWAGVRFSDFAAKYGLDVQTKFKYGGLVTPDKKYYVGIDMPSLMHPQTILCYEMNGQPLPINQGYPLRLIIPVKYGIKHLKRISTITFSNERPADYWYERGYDYYSGL